MSPKRPFLRISVQLRSAHPPSAVTGLQFWLWMVMLLEIVEERSGSIITTSCCNVKWLSLGYHSMKNGQRCPIQFCQDVYPLVNKQFAIENGPVEIVDLMIYPFIAWWIFPSFFLCLPEGNDVTLIEQQVMQFIVDLLYPIKMVILHSFLYVYQRVISNHSSRLPTACFTVLGHGQWLPQRTDLGSHWRMTQFGEVFLSRHIYIYIQLKYVYK